MTSAREWLRLVIVSRRNCARSGKDYGLRWESGLFVPGSKYAVITTDVSARIGRIKFWPCGLWLRSAARELSARTIL